MGMYFTEMHCHTAEASICAEDGCEKVVETYIAAGYTTVVLTNHINEETYKLFGTEDEDEFAEKYVSAYRKMKEYARDRLNVIFGAEVNFRGMDINDYLTYGLTEEFFLSHTGFNKMNIRDYADMIHEAGMLVYQAHPFRNRMNLADPKTVDGIEAFNGSIFADSHNDLADMWANSYAMSKTSGSDYHGGKSEIAGGIITDEPIKTTEDLLSTLRSGDYILHKTVIPGMSRPM